MLYVALLYYQTPPNPKIAWLGNPTSDLRQALAAVYHPESFGYRADDEGMGAIVFSVPEEKIGAFLHQNHLEGEAAVDYRLVFGRYFNDGRWLVKWYDDAACRRYQDVEFGPPAS